MSKMYTVQPTGDRLNAKGVFVAQLNPSDIKGNMKVGKNVVVVHKVNKSTFKVKARLQSLVDVPVGSVRLDQKIRMSIGVRKGGMVTVEASIRLKEMRSTFSARFFGRQVNMLRVRKATFSDMEINLCRVESAVMESIAVDSGDKIIVESTTAKIEIRMLGLTQEMIDLRKVKADDKEKSMYNSHDKRRLAIEKGNPGKYDLPWIMLDNDARSLLGVDAYDPVMVYRSNSFAVKQKLHTLTTPMAIGFVGLFVGLESFSEYGKNVKAIIEISGFIVAGALTILFSMLNIRNRLK